MGFSRIDYANGEGEVDVKLLFKGMAHVGYDVVVLEGNSNNVLIRKQGNSSGENPVIIPIGRKGGQFSIMISLSAVGTAGNVDSFSTIMMVRQDELVLPGGAENFQGQAGSARVNFIQRYDLF